MYVHAIAQLSRLMQEREIYLITHHAKISCLTSCRKIYQCYEITLKCHMKTRKQKCSSENIHIECYLLFKHMNIHIYLCVCMKVCAHTNIDLIKCLQE